MEATALRNMMILLATALGGRATVTVEYDYLNPAAQGDDTVRPSRRTVQVNRVWRTREGHWVLNGEDAYRTAEAGGDRRYRTYRLDQVRLLVDVDAPELAGLAAA